MRQRMSYLLISTEKKCHVSSLVTDIHVRFWPLADMGLCIADPKRTLDVGRIFGLDDRESYRELRLEPLCCLTV
jgi:hypothetical protein